MVADLVASAGLRGFHDRADVVGDLTSATFWGLMATVGL